MNLSESIEVLRLMCDLKIPTNSIFCQSLLKKIQREIGSLTDLNFINVEELWILLKKMRKSTLVISIMNDLKITQKSFNKEQSIYSMCSNLYRAANSMHVNKELLISIMQSISNYRGEIPIFSAISIYNSCLKFPEILTNENIDFRKIENVIITNSKQVTYGHVCKILLTIAKLSAQKKLHDPYNPELIDSLISAQLTRKLSFENEIEILSYLQQIGHLNTNLLDDLIVKCLEDQFLIMNLSRVDLLKFTGVLSICVETPPLWDLIKNIILKNKICKDITIPLAYNLTVLNFRPQQLISEALKITESKYYNLYEYTRNQALFVYQVIKTLDKDYNGPWPSRTVLKAILQQKSIITHAQINEDVLCTLEKALGGSEYVQSTLLTTYRHFINHIVVMRKGGFPMAINHSDNKKTVTYIDDIIVPSDSKIIAILYFDTDNYLRNINKLKTQFVLYMKSIEALGYSVIPLNLKEWTSMSNKDKIPFIMNEIKSRYPDEI
ncbi:FAST kinase domain-containing protein 1, mitochondrial-like [Leptopilina heterotoma]|uniref:FAST kinase domain-containing protein 1, mitochondrial-like n=1 Tax=Leptopilina heterotoma TaxID=63436 RepID=UPI001CA97626|nr:FAST kinase domain-containing protein 1, mitochondrial-like [Leptopilina heterotoma]